MRYCYLILVGLVAMPAALGRQKPSGWVDTGTVVRLKNVNDSVGLGTTDVMSKLTVGGTIESKFGGFVFPDGTVQTTAALYVQDPSGGQGASTSSGTVLDVTAYGAIGDGLHDDTGAFMLALSTLSEHGGGELYVPRGVYSLSARLNIANSITLAGDGLQASKLVWMNGDGGVRVIGGNALWDNRTVVHVHDLSFLTSVPQGGTALLLDYDLPVGAIQSFANIERVEFSGIQGGYWSIGVHHHNVRGTTIRQCDFKGSVTSSSPFAPGAKGILIDGPNHQVDHFIESSRFWFLDRCVDIGGATEGVVINGVQAVGINCGVRVETDGGCPGVVVTNSHFDIWSVALDLVTATDSTVTNNLIYTRVNPPGTLAGVFIRGKCKDVHVAGNIFHGHGADFNGVVVVGPADEVTVALNKFAGCSTAVWLKNTSGCMVLDNDFDSSGANVLMQPPSSANFVRKMPWDN